MVNKVVSVRIPDALIEDLKTCSEHEHFLGVSETVRSIVREEWLEAKNPVHYHLEKLRSEIQDQVTQQKEEQLVKELKRIRDSLLKK